MNRRPALILSLSLAAAALAAGFAPRVAARTNTALHGYIRPADRACFQESWGSMVNTCSNTRQIFIPASYDKHCVSGANWKVTAQSNSSSANVCCRMIGIDGSQIYAGSFTCLPSFGAPREWTLNGASLWHDRAFYVCDVGPNAKVLGVEYSAYGDC
jgi:hypothetical protein